MSATPSLGGKVAVVTGASRGIGRAIAVGLAREGCDVVIAAKSTESTAKLPGSVFTVAAEVEALGARALPVPVDVRDAILAAVLGGRPDDFPTLPPSPRLRDSDPPGELTVSLKTRRGVIFERHHAELEALYREGASVPCP